MDGNTADPDPKHWLKKIFDKEKTSCWLGAWARGCRRGRWWTPESRNSCRPSPGPWPSSRSGCAPGPGASPTPGTCHTLY